MYKYYTTTNKYSDKDQDNFVDVFCDFTKKWAKSSQQRRIGDFKNIDMIEQYPLIVIY